MPARIPGRRYTLAQRVVLRQRCVRQACRDPLGVSGGNDLIVAAPENPHRCRDLAEQVLVLGCVGLTQLAVVRRLAVGADPTEPANRVSRVPALEAVAFRPVQGGAENVDVSWRGSGARDARLLCGRIQVKVLTTSLAIQCATSSG